MINDSSILDSVKKGIYCNQISPLGASLLRQFLTQIPDHQADIYAYEQAGRLALRFNNKKAYVHLLQRTKNPHALPNHVPTAFISFNEIQRIRWHDLHRIFTHQIGSNHTPELYVKSSLDCGGEGSVLISEKNFDEKIATLKKELCDKQKHRGRKNSNLDLLVQSRVQSNEDGKYPTNIGFVYYIHDMNMIKRIDIHGQIYADPERIEYLGSYLSKDFEAKILSLVDERKILNLCQLFAQEGYRGPINFDAVRNTHNEIAFIFDCNPRMSAAFPNIALSIFLQTLPLPVCSLANIGYRGRMIFENISEKLHELDCANLLFTHERKKGVFILPSFARNNGYDVWMINMSLNEMKTFIEDGYLTSLSNKKECDYTGFYF